MVSEWHGWLYISQNERGWWVPLLHPAAWPALGFAAFTIILERDLDKARAGWSERMIKKTLNSF